MQYRSRVYLPLLMTLAFWTIGSASADEVRARPNKIYGEWLIRPQPAKGTEYRQLIAQKGLPLFREAGGRMVGWWNTLVGNLYEQVTIWEYDDMAAFQKAVEFLGKNERFARFVAERDALLAGEQNRFLKLAAFAEKPQLQESASFVIHEIHRVPMPRLDAYLKFMENEGLALLKKHGFRPVGPWTVAVGKWTEVTYLFRFNSLAERDKLIADFSAHPDGTTYGKVTELVEDISTRLLIPTPFAAPPRQPARRQRSSSLLPHFERITPTVHVAGFSDRHRNMNCGWVTLRDGVLLVDLPRGVPVPAFLSEVAQSAGKPVRALALTHLEPGDGQLVAALLDRGVDRVLTSPEIGRSLVAESKIPAARVKSFAVRTAIADEPNGVEFIPWEGIAGPGGAAVYLPEQQVLFAGPFVVNGPRARLRGSDTGLWVESLRRLEKLGAVHIVPGFGSWGGADLLARQRRFLVELRRQVGFVIARGQTREALQDRVRIPTDYLVWKPYDTPTAEDIDYVYGELTIPVAPFNGRLPKQSDPAPHALVLVGDGPHEPGVIEEGLRPVFEATGITPHFAVDVRALSASNLAKVRLLVIFRDGLQRVQRGQKPGYEWMTPEQERAVVQFVEGGGGFLNLHNALALYPADGPYLKLAGGRYIGHGPLERFRVEVVDPDHSITRGVRAFSIADEQHTPIPESGKVYLLLRNRSDDGKVAAAGWAYEPGRGRLCHLANGHTREALLNPMYQLLLRNAVNWCLRRDVVGSSIQTDSTTRR